VPIKTFVNWNEARPGFLEIDLVAHCGSTSGGQFLFTLSTVDGGCSGSRRLSTVIVMHHKNAQRTGKVAEANYLEARIEMAPR
jgi:hypothetical protein